MIAKLIKALLVEDNKISQIAAKYTLQLVGCEVDLAVSGDEALALALNNSYDVIFMDIALGDTDGFFVTKQIRNQGKLNKTCPIIALTAHSDKIYRDKAKEAGMNAYINKPLEADHVKNLIDTFIMEPSHA